MTQEDNEHIKRDIRYIRLLEKRRANKPDNSKQLQRRTLHSSLAILDNLSGLEFSDFSRELYFLCNNSKTEEMTRAYESQLELAIIDPDKFVRSIHKFYSDMERKIKSENLYSNFFQFMSYFCMKRYSFLDSPIRRKISNAYVNLLLQQTEHLRYDKYDLSKRVMGISTDGQLILKDDYMPYLDNVTNTIEYESLVLGKLKTPAEFNRRFEQLLNLYDMPLASMDTYMVFSEVDKLFANTACVMTPYINQYTCDILPDAFDPLRADIIDLIAIQTDMDADSLKEKLKHRARTLPANGAIFSFGEAQVIRSVKLKETLVGDEIIMLYKLYTSIGQSSGFYNTNTGTFFSILMGDNTSKVFNNIQCLVLYLYACAVLRDGRTMLDQAPNVIQFQGGIEYTLSVELRGGKPRDEYHPQRLGTTYDESKYQSEERQIQGYVRRLPPGRHASREAQDRAKLLGFELEENETYVQGFVKTVSCLKDRSTQ